MFLAGDVAVFSAQEREFEGRKYYSVTAIGTDKEIYKFSAPYEDAPKENDAYQMIVTSGSRDCKPMVRFQKVK